MESKCLAKCKFWFREKDVMYAINMHRHIYICLCVYVFSESPWTAIRKYNMFCGLIIDFFLFQNMQCPRSCCQHIWLDMQTVHFFSMHHHITVMRIFAISYYFHKVIKFHYGYSTHMTSSKYYYFPKAQPSSTITVGFGFKV